MKRQQVPVEHLQFGMYVAELDRPWTETPFMFQGFVLKTDKQLDALKKYCKHVFVDADLGDAYVPPAGATAGARPAGPMSITAAGMAIKGKTVYQEVAPIEAEFERAQAVYAENSKRFDEIFKMAKTGDVLDAKNVKEAVTHITESVVRNPDAMLLVAKLRQKSDYAASRSLDVSVYMTVFGRYLQLAREELDLLGTLGLLQDVGMMKLPDELVQRQRQLTPAEVEVFRSHVEHSKQILEKTQGLPPKLAELATLHHERFDGTGYPRSLKGPQIGLHGLIAGIVDSFDMLTRARLGVEPLSPSNALNVLYKERGTGYDGGLVEQFIQCIGIFPVGSVVELNSGEVGLVITQNLVRRLKPRVMVVLDAKGNPMRPHKILDLEKDPKVSADEPYRIRRTLEHGKVEVDPKEFFL